MRKSSLMMASSAMLAMSSNALAAPAIIHNAAYANTLTDLIPDIYTALDVVSRELVGFIPSASRDSNAERAAVGQNVIYQVAPEASTADIVPAMIVPEPDDKEIGSDFIAITKAKQSNFGFIGEEQRGLNTGVGYLSVQAGLIAQALRTLTNEIERDLAVEISANASRAISPASAGNPFAEGVGDAAQVRKVLDDNGAPSTGRSLIMNTSAGANVRTNMQLTKANEAGSTMTLRQGELLDIHNLSLKESGQSVQHVAGDASGATTTDAGFAQGETQIVIAAGGTGAILAGDVISFAGDVSKYMVVSGIADVSAGGTLTITKPGLQTEIPAGATAITVESDYSANVGFSSNALHLVTRAPALPQEGDAAVERMMIVDPRSGLAFELSIYAGYRKMRAEIALAWGVKATKSEHTALLLG